MKVLVDTPIWSLALRRKSRAENASTRCREKGIQGSNTDFLICAIAARNELSIFTTDEDFKYFAEVLPIVLHDTAG